MVLLKLKYFCKISWTFIKKYWKQISVFLLIVFFYITSKQKVENLIKIMEKQKEISDKEIAVLKESYEKERAQKEKARITRQAIIEKIEKKYEEKNLELDNYKRMQIEKILSETKDDPDVITKRLSRVTGFDINE